MKRNALAALVAAILTACGSLAGMHPGSVPAPVISPATPTASATPSDSPTPSSTPSAAAPPPAATAAPPLPTMLSRTVPLIAIGGGRVSGFVQVTERNGSFLATVSARGLTPGLHAVHIHRGNCANPYAGVHLTVLGLLAADGSGSGTLAAGIGSVYVAPGRYVIVYASTSPQIIVGCADLVALS